MANGTAVIICPGGGFHALSINSEGVDVAKWLNDKGVTGFVLKYRLVPTGKDGVREMLARNATRSRRTCGPRFLLAAADGVGGREVRSPSTPPTSASPERIGLMGFSAGGSVTAAVALNYLPTAGPISWHRSMPISA